VSAISRWTVRLAAAATIAALAAGAVVAADGIGVMVAPSGEQLTEQEALYAEATVAALVAEGRRAAFLYDGSPLVRAEGVSLPAVGAADDWTPLVSVLDRLARSLRLDYVLLTALDGADAQSNGRALLVVRGGEGSEIQTDASAEPRQVAEQLGRRVTEAIDRLPAPSDGEDEAVPVAPAEPEAEEPIVARPGDEDGGEAKDDVPDTEDAPLIVADEPAAEPEPADTRAEDAEPEPRPVDDALVAAEQAYEAGDLDCAEAMLEASLRESGASARAYFLRARLALARQDRDGAIAHLKRAVGMDPTLADAQVWLGRLLSEEGLWQSAQQHYERAVEANPTHVGALLGLARLYRDHGHRQKAIEVLTAADDAGQDDPSLLMLLGELHGAEGNIELAERYFLRAVALAEEKQQAAVWERLADLYVELHRHREALMCYVKAAELNPSRASMVGRRYAEVMTAADGAVHEALTTGWNLFEDFAQNGVGEREIVYRRLSEMHAQLKEATRFAESINPPGNLNARHIDRKFAYSLAVESTVLALSWLDLGDESMLDRAGEVHADAVEQFRRLSDDEQT
jgi:tetratricopeptide (TPR) repeat protein